MCTPVHQLNCLTQTSPPRDGWLACVLNPTLTGMLGVLVDRCAYIRQATGAVQAYLDIQKVGLGQPCNVALQELNQYKNRQVYRAATVPSTLLHTQPCTVQELNLKKDKHGAIRWT